MHHAETDWANDGQTNIDDPHPGLRTGTTGWSNPAAGKPENLRTPVPSAAFSLVTGGLAGR